MNLFELRILGFTAVLICIFFFWIGLKYFKELDELTRRHDKVKKGQENQQFDGKKRK